MKWLTEFGTKFNRFSDRFSANLDKANNITENVTNPKFNLSKVLGFGENARKNIIYVFVGFVVIIILFFIFKPKKSRR